jgi:hypothetical protein
VWLQDAQEFLTAEIASLAAVCLLPYLSAEVDFPAVDVDFRAMDVDFHAVEVHFHY